MYLRRIAMAKDLFCVNSTRWMMHTSAKYAFDYFIRARDFVKGVIFLLMFTIQRLFEQSPSSVTSFIQLSQHNQKNSLRAQYRLLYLHHLWFTRCVLLPDGIKFTEFIPLFIRLLGFLFLVQFLLSRHCFVLQCCPAFVTDFPGWQWALQVLPSHFLLAPTHPHRVSRAPGSASPHPGGRYYWQRWPWTHGGR